MDVKKSFFTAFLAVLLLCCTSRGAWSQELPPAPSASDTGAGSAQTYVASLPPPPPPSDGVVTPPPTTEPPSVSSSNDEVIPTPDDNTETPSVSATPSTEQSQSEAPPLPQSIQQGEASGQEVEAAFNQRAQMLRVAKEQYSVLERLYEIHCRAEQRALAQAPNEDVRYQVRQSFSRTKQRTRRRYRQAGNTILVLQHQVGLLWKAIHQLRVHDADQDARINRMGTTMEQLQQGFSDLKDTVTDQGDSIKKSESFLKKAFGDTYQDFDPEDSSTWKDIPDLTHPVSVAPPVTIKAPAQPSGGSVVRGHKAQSPTSKSKKTGHSWVWIILVVVIAAFVVGAVWKYLGPTSMLEKIITTMIVVIIAAAIIFWLL